MYGLSSISTAALSVLDLLGAYTNNTALSCAMGSAQIHSVVTDLTVHLYTPSEPHTGYAFDPLEWHRIEKDLHLHAIKQSAWLYVRCKPLEELEVDGLVVADIHIGSEPQEAGWENRPGGIWLHRTQASVAGDNAISNVNVLFGTDAVDPRPGWTLFSTPLSLNAPSDVPVARLSILRGRPQARSQSPILRASETGNFKILQVSDFHMVTGPGICKDSIDADGKPLPPRDADPLTVAFLEHLVDLEKPDLVILTGDQLDEMNRDAETAIYKSVAPLIRRSIPFATVFGNHDDEGPFSLSRSEQMSILQTLPFSLSHPGPPEIDGIGNYHLPIQTPSTSHPFTTLFFLDSHGSAPTKVKNPDYKHITQAQITWFLETSASVRQTSQAPHNLFAFFHIPFEEFASSPSLSTHAGERREPTEGPSFNSHFYDALVKQKVLAVGTGHDHVNDFCALKGGKGPWLCYAGGAGFGGYCSYDGHRYHRRARVWELNAESGDVRTWTRREYGEGRLDEIVLARGGTVVVPGENGMADVDQTVMNT